MSTTSKLQTTPAKRSSSTKVRATRTKPNAAGPGAPATAGSSATFATDFKNTPPWTRAFVDIATRAICRIHYHYLLWSIPSVHEKEDVDSTMLTGPGVALADELTVCAAITQEFFSSRSASGGWIEEVPESNIAKGPRFFRLHRETNYSHSNARADMRIERVDLNKGASKIGRPALIEAKRAYRWATKLDGDDAGSKPTSPIKEINEDIDALRAEVSHLQAQSPPAPSDDIPRGYILLWNITDKSRGTDVSPEDFLKNVSSPDLIVWQVRIVPMAASLSGPARRSLKGTRISRWLWVLLAEVTPTGPNDRDPRRADKAQKRKDKDGV